MWVPGPVVRLEIRASGLADNSHGCWDAEAGVIDLDDPRFIRFHTDDSIEANLGDDYGGPVKMELAQYRKIRARRILCVHTNEGGL